MLKTVFALISIAICWQPSLSLSAASFSAAPRECDAGAGSFADDVPPPLRTVTVSSVAALQTAINNAVAGDHIVLDNGVYDLKQSFAVTGKNGAAANPIVIRANSVLGVTFTGTGSFNVEKSSHVVIQGFRFTGKTGKNGAQGLNLKNSNFCRVTRNYFQMVDSGKAYWTYIFGAGDDHRIDRNEYARKPSEGCFIVVYGASEPYGMAQRVRIDRNYFHHQTFTGANGGEAIRFGDSNRQNIDAFGAIENNLFEANTGDVEVISVKSSSNKIQFNTLRGNRGSIVLRHGDDNTVAGNFLLDGANGIRFYGDNHRIVNNYFAGNNGEEARSALAVGNGDAADAANGDTGYDQPQGVVVAFNTFVGNTTNAVFGVRGSAKYPPDAIVFANNILQGDAGALVSTDVGTPRDTVWQGNILWGAASAGIIPATGYKRVNPLLSVGLKGVFRIAPDSPAINAAANSGDYDFVTTDADGQTRMGAPDVGSDECSVGTITRFPLAPADVGPNAP